MASSTKTCGTAANENSTGTTAWVDPSNVCSGDDDVYATINVAAGVYSQWLYCTNFGFAIPGGATIDGIETVYDRIATGGANGEPVDRYVRIVKGGAIGSNEKSTNSLWTLAFPDEEKSFGGAAELWGETWTPTDINSSTFGCAISIGPSAFGGAGSIDRVRITVTYTAAAAFDNPPPARVFFLPPHPCQIYE